MAYRCPKLVLKDGTVTFKILYERHVNGARTYRGVGKDEWAALGLSPTMTLAEAKRRVSELNEGEGFKRREASREAVKERFAAEKVVVLQFLPKSVVEKFYAEVVTGRRASEKSEFMWRTVQRMFVELKIPVGDWESQAAKFYDWFIDNEYSLDYVGKIISMANKWGAYWARATGVPFYPLPKPANQDRADIEIAHDDRENRQGNSESEPLEWKSLQSKQSMIKPEHYNWMYISLWCGLRPHEVNNLKDPVKFRFEKTPMGWALWVYQDKLVRFVKRIERWKYIPLVETEQKIIKELVERGQFKQPHGDVFKNAFGEGFKPYAGRKGFHGLMTGLGYTDVQVQIWMGHKNFNTTYKHYVDKKKVVWPDKD